MARANISAQRLSSLRENRRLKSLRYREKKLVRIIKIHATTASMQSDIRNAYVDFTQMTTSVVAVVTDVVREGKPVIGYGFNSNGRYAATGLLKERFVPRLERAAPESLLTDAGDNLDPHRIWQTMMTGEKPGGHGERAVAVGTVDMAVWDAVAKIEEKPLYRLLADRYRNGEVDERVFVYAAGGYYQPDKGLSALQDEMRGYLDLGYTVVKMKIGGAPLAEDMRRIEAVLAIVGDGQSLAVDANGRFDLATRSLTRTRSRHTICAGTKRRATHSITRFRQRSAQHYPLPSRPVRTSSRCRTRAT